MGHGLEQQDQVLTRVADTPQFWSHDQTELLRNHDVVLWTHSSLYSPPACAPAQREFLKQARDVGCLSVGFHLDRFWDLAREKSIHTEAWFGADLVLTADGGNDERFRAAGVNHRWLQPGVHGPDTLLRPKRSARHRARVAFVGSWQHYHPEWPWRKELIATLTNAYGRNFSVFPRGNKRIWGQELVDLYASVDVVVGDSCFAGQPNGQRYFSDRPYETVGRGGFLVFPRVEGLEGHLRDGEHIVYYDAGDAKGLVDTINTYLDNKEERQRIASQGRREVHLNHTYRNRARDMLIAIVETRPKLMGWMAPVREGTYDAVAVRETWLEDSYHAVGHVGPGDTVVDLGANIGAFTIWAAKQGARVIAVEPVPGNLAQLRRNIETMGVTDRVTIIESAVGETEGTIRMNFFDSDRSQSGYRHEDGELEVKVLPLDMILPECEVAMLKVDIEGSEIHALSGANLRSCRRVSIETHNTRDPGTTHERVKAILSPTHNITETGGHSEGYVWGVRR